MSDRTTIKDPGQIPVILDVIHDCWFDVDDLLFNPETSILSIKFRREIWDQRRLLKKIWLWKKVEIPIFECFLKFHHVKSYTVNDTERVGMYDFNELEYDPKSQRISITTGVPIDVEIMVENFEICVEVTDTITELKTSTSIFN
jgi:hypothetical protein